MCKILYPKVLVVFAFVLTLVSIGYAGRKSVNHSQELKNPSDTHIETVTTNSPKISEIDTSDMKSDHTLPSPTPVIGSTNSMVAASPSSAPALGLIPDNASVVVGMVLTRTVWAPGTLLGSLPPLPPDRTWYSIQLRIESVTQAQPDLPSMAEPGVIEAFSRDPLSSELVGARVEARLKTVGNTLDGTRWWISDIRVVLPQH
jgi:hypothetical protein